MTGTLILHYAVNRPGQNRDPLTVQAILGYHARSDAGRFRCAAGFPGSLDLVATPAAAAEVALASRSYSLFVFIQAFRS